MLYNGILPGAPEISKKPARKTNIKPIKSKLLADPVKEEAKH